MTSALIEAVEALNLKRRDIAEMLEGENIVCNISTLRRVSSLIENHRAAQQEKLKRIKEQIGQADYHMQALHGGMIILDHEKAHEKCFGWVCEGSYGFEQLRRALELLDTLIEQKEGG